MRHSLLRPLLLLFLGVLCSVALRAQFYSGSQQEYGKNRVQYQDFLWQYYRFPELETYFYKEGRDAARFVAISAHRHKKELEKFFDYTIDDRLQFIVYNSLTDFRQSNIGITGDEQYNIGGVTRIVGTKVFVYNEGDKNLLDRQVRSGIAELMIDQMMYGGNWREVLKNSTLLSLPEWYTKGLSAYCAGPWEAHAESRIRDAVLNDRYRRIDRLEGENAQYAGLLLWTYVADTYGPSVIPNILYMTRVSRNPDNGFSYVLGVGLNTLTEECLAHYRSLFQEQDRMRSAPNAEEWSIKTRKRRNYSQFKLSPDGRYAAWVSNELGQYKVWLYDRAEKKVKKLVKGEKKLNRIVDRSFPVLAWHPSGRALTWTTEKRGELFLTTYSIDDRTMTRKPVFMLEKILSMAYSDDGQNMIFSGVREGRTDLYLYYVIGNRQEQLTNDLYDDLDPAFADGGRSVLFSSDRTDDTLRSSTEVVWTNAHKDIFRYDLVSRSPVLARLTSTPGVDERQPMQYDSANYTYLGRAGGVQDRWLLHFDSTIAAVDTAIHYRYFTTQVRATNLKQGIEEHDVIARRGWLSQMHFANGKYHFLVGTTRDPSSAAAPYNGERPKVDDRSANSAVTDDMSPVVKVDPQEQRDTSTNAIDIHNYRFLDEGPAPATAQGSSDVAARNPGGIGNAGFGMDGASTDTTLITRLVFPDQRNYNVNFATDEVLTQLDNNFDGRFYQPITGDAAMNPGLSGLTRMAMSDLFEDYKITGGFRLALDLANNTYMLKLQNLKRRMDKELVLQRQARQALSDLGVIKVHTHQASFRLTYPFSELACLRGSVFYRHDRYVLQSTDIFSLTAANYYDQLAGGKLEYVFDSSVPFGLNLYTGWKLKFFGEYYKQLDQELTDMQVVGMDLRHSLRIHRELIWVNRFAGCSSLGSRKVLFFLGGVDNWLFPKINSDTPIDPTQNYTYQSLGVPVRGFFYNIRNGNSFAVWNSELRVPIFRYLLNRPVRSDFFQNFQIVGFGDIGAAWTGSGPYADDNYFNTQTISRGPVTIRIKNQREPIVGGYGFGLRSRLLGYFVRADWAWGVDDGVIQDGVFHFSLSLDI